MQHESAPVDPARLPTIADAARAEQGLQRWRRVVERLSPGAVRERLAAIGADSAEEALLAGVFSNSPYLGDSLLAEPATLDAVLHDGPGATVAALEAELTLLDRTDRGRLMAAMRRLKRRAHLAIALADLAGMWTLDEVTGALSRLADGACEVVLRHLLDQAHTRGEIELADPDHPTIGSGLFVLGMGKLGACELNYSSDIDLIVLYDEARLRYRGREAPIALAARTTRSLVYMLEESTQDGYVFRTDLRLRPHPPGHPLALPVEAAEIYYERHGQNWERAALIKARAIAGDIEAGETFLAHIAPFLWRRHLDYAAIDDIHSIKRQINAHRGFGSIRVHGHDIKVGRGGIREIEFFAQTQQLILGGRVPELRVRGTCEALRALVETRWLAEETADELIAAYGYLRRVEHRLQMVADRQTHRLPDRDGEFARLAAFLGEADADRLASRVKTTLERVEAHYAQLFETGPDLGGGGNLVFTGTDDDPDTLSTLGELGFADPSAISTRVRAWHHGHVRATRSTRARELLTEMMPALLEALARQADPDAAFELFDQFLAGLPSGVQLFSLLRANPRLLKLLAEIMGLAPRLARHLSHNVDLFDAMLAPDFFEDLPEADVLVAELDQRLESANDLQDVLDIARLWAHGRQFQAGLQVLLGASRAERAAETLTAIADSVLQALLPWVERWLEEQHGHIAGGRFVVLGLGKLGSRELTIGSDLDLIFVYDAPEDARSEGARPLAAASYFPRLGQRLVSAITAKTAEGTLFEIDMRLRPSGKVGPVASSLRSFEAYQQETAQTWEHQALTRARVVAGDAELAARVESFLHDLLTRPREPAAVASDIGAMRARIFREHGDDDPWNLKYTRGGVVETEFAAQYLQLAHAARHPELLGVPTTEVFARAAEADLITADEAADLASAARLQQRLQAVLRLSLSERFAREHAPQGLREALVRAAYPPAEGEAPLVDFPTLESNLARAQARARAIFDVLVASDDDTAIARKERHS